MINFRAEFEFKEQIISRCTVILSPNRLREGPVVVGSAEHTRRFIVGSSSRTVAQPSTPIGQQSHNRADFTSIDKHIT